MSSANSPLAVDGSVADDGEGGSFLPSAPEPSSPRSSSSSPVTQEAGRREAGQEATTAAVAASSLIADELNTLGGFDLCHPFHTSWYNSLLAEEGILGDGEGGTLIPLPEDGGIRSLSFDDSSSSSRASASTSAAGDIGGGTDVAAASSESACRRRCNALLIGNTRRMWPRFVDWLVREKKERSEYDDDGEVAFDALLSNDPLDSFVTEIIGDVVSRHAPRDFRPYDGNGGGMAGVIDAETKVEEVVTTGVVRAGEHGEDEFKPGTGTRRNDARGTGGRNYEIFWSHDTTPRRLVSMQRVAQAAGLCYFDREYTMLSVHPTYGPWLAFRAVVVFFDVKADVDVDEGGGTASRSVPRPSTSRPPPRPPSVECLLTEEERAAAARISLQSPALSCTDGGGRDLLREILHGAGTDAKGERDVTVLDDVHIALIARRDCVALGRERYRYSEGQILYHYTKDSRVLLKEIMSSSSSRGEDTCT